ncbi:MAG: ribonuclease III, partial [Deltaproteobacteria bacterium]|nr:ribonuclease III [Deltaproteobacteria bacterium]
MITVPKAGPDALPALDPALNVSPPGDLQNLKICLLGIGGVAMASLAGLLTAKGAQVTGADLDVYPPASGILERAGLKFHHGWDALALEPRPDLVIVGNVVTRGMPVVAALRDQEIPYLSLPQALERWFLADTLNLVVSGCHGKTTTTNLAAHIFERGALRPGFLIGGASLDFKRPFRLGSDGGWFIIEGDEYDCAFFDKRPKFVHYHPRMAILTSVEFDHADIYPDQAAVTEAYAALVESIPPDGLLIAKGDDPKVRKVAELSRCPRILYGAAGSRAPLDIVVEGWKPKGLGGVFTLRTPFESPLEAQLSLPGLHNALNAAAASGAYLAAGGHADDLVETLRLHKGTRRRQEVVGLFGYGREEVLVIDDFAHHPTAVARTLEALRLSCPGRRLICAFEARSNTSRRAIFQKAYAHALKTAHMVYLAPVNQPEKAPEGDRLDLERLRRDIGPAAIAPDLDTLVADMARRVQPGDVVCFMSNGGFGNLPLKLVERLAPRFGAPAPKARMGKLGLEDGEAPAPVEELAEKLGMEFSDTELLTAAMTHRSILGLANRNHDDGETNNQRLEFLGDAVLDMCVADLLFPVRPRLSEGQMTRLRSWMVCEARLAEVAKTLDLGRYLIMAPSERAAGGRFKVSALADAMEALVAAVFLVRGFEAARDLISRLFAPYMTPEILAKGPADYKTNLQELTQSIKLGLPAYSIASTSGEAHRQIFTAEVRIGGAVFSGQGTTRKDAEQEAAKLM